jgi:hypothetical protein
MQHPHGDPSDSFLAEIVDDIFLPLVAPAGGGESAGGQRPG